MIPKYQDCTNGVTSSDTFVQWQQRDLFALISRPPIVQYFPHRRAPCSIVDS